MSVLAAFTRLDDATDGQLLGRFVTSRDADAFAALVRRLGPTVLAVCRRVCPDAHLAEDAFQAAFLVLAKKADAVKPREQVAVWLHGVAYRTAAKARTMLSARRRRETGSPDLPDLPARSPTAPADDELRKLDAAITALPERLRAVVVLCELEGRSRKEAARELGIAEGTLSSRLADARKRLGARLRPTTAVVTAALATGTAEAVVGGSTSETVNTLARGVMSMLLLNRLKLPVVVLLAAALSGIGVAVWPASHLASAAPVPKPPPPRAGLIGVSKGNSVSLLTPDGEVKYTSDLIADWGIKWLAGPSVVYPSPNGFPVVVFVSRARNDTRAERRLGYELWMIASADKTPKKPVDLGDHLTGRELTTRAVWSRDGSKCFIEHRTSRVFGVKAAEEHSPYLEVTATGKVRASVVPLSHTLLGETPEGDLVTDRTVTLAERRQPDTLYLASVSPDGKETKGLKSFEGKWDQRALHPDGRTLLLSHSADGAASFWTFDTLTGERTALVVEGLAKVKHRVTHVRWSPDGRRIGLVYQPADRTQRQADSVLYVCDAHGTNGRELQTWKVTDDTFDTEWPVRFEWN